jgi:gas vesicle protein
MTRNLVAILIGLAIGALTGMVLRRRSKRARADALIKHPERLEQMLDPTDDA